jgi:hypothetical protein
MKIKNETEYKIKDYSYLDVFKGKIKMVGNLLWKKSLLQEMYYLKLIS